MENTTKVRFFQTDEYGRVSQQFDKSCDVPMTGQNWADILTGLFISMFAWVDARKNRGRKAWDSSPIYLVLTCGEIQFNSLFEVPKDHSEYKAGNDAQRLKFTNSIKVAFASKFFSNARCEPYDNEKYERELMNRIKAANIARIEANKERANKAIERVMNAIKLLPKQLPEVTQSEAVEFSLNGKTETIEA